MRPFNELPPGLELDLLVAARVYGLRLPDDKGWLEDDRSWVYLGRGSAADRERFINTSLPKYSTVIGCAWPLIKKVGADNMVRGLVRCSGYGGNDAGELTLLKLLEWNPAYQLCCAALHSLEA